MHRFALVSFLVFAGCGGLSNNTKLSDLEAEDADALCEKMGPEEVVTCEIDGGGSVDVTVGCDPDEINEDNFTNTFPESCEATVGDFLDCMDAVRAAVEAEDCAAQMSVQPEECDAFFACIETD